MASLSSIPTEILILIIQAVGSSHLYKCLTLNKRWYHHAQVILVSDIYLNAEGLLRFSRMSTRVETLLKSHLRNLNIKFIGYEKWASIDSVVNPPEVIARYGSFHDPNVVDHRALVLFHFSDRLEASFKHLATVLRDCVRLEAFSIRGSPELMRYNSASERVVTRQILQHSWLALLFSSIPCASLTSLEVDLNACYADVGDEVDQPHLCPIIAKLFGRVRKLRLRLASICANVLDLPPDRSGRLESAVINLSMHNFWDPDDTDQLEFTCLCEGYELDESETFRDWLLPKAIRVARRLPDLKSMRILYHERLTSNPVALDCLTGAEIRDENCWGEGWIEAGENNHGMTYFCDPTPKIGQV